MPGVRRWLRVVAGGCVLLAGVTACGTASESDGWIWMGIEGTLAPGHTVAPKLSDLGLPKDCVPNDFTWWVSYNSIDSSSTDGPTFGITPLMAGSVLEVIVRVPDACGGALANHRDAWLIQASTKDSIETVVVPVLAGDLYPGGSAWVEPGVWAPADVDVVYLWTPSPDVPKNPAMLDYMMNGYFAYAPTGPEVTIPEDWAGRTMTVWAGVGYENYLPLVFQVGQVELGPVGGEGASAG